MPAGIAVELDNGFATLEFLDKAARGRALEALIRVGGPATIEKLTREKGARSVRYRVPEGNAREAGLLDDYEVGLSNVVASGGTDATGIVLPETPTSKGLVHGQQLRSGTYRGGDTGNVHTTTPSDPVARGIATPTHAEVIEHVAASGPVQPQGVPAEAYPAPEPGGAYIGMQGLGEAVTPAEAETSAAGDGGVVVDVPGDDDIVAKQAWPAGEPNEDWKRSELDAYAASIGINTKNLDNKAAVLDALKK
ncbi:hypothetical protein SEA_PHANTASMAGORIA_17 [Mycobacterium phage Phantasmagoria]|nr:hypothetical protein SEA_PHANTASMAGORIA_17 [Mycobacterium phage Phantasmagoria]